MSLLYILPLSHMPQVLIIQMLTPSDPLAMCRIATDGKAAPVARGNCVMPRKGRTILDTSLHHCRPRLQTAPGVAHSNINRVMVIATILPTPSAQEQPLDPDPAVPRPTLRFTPSEVFLGWVQTLALPRFRAKGNLPFATPRYRGVDLRYHQGTERGRRVPHYQATLRRLETGLQVGVRGG